MNTYFQLFIEKTRDAVILEAKSFNEAYEEATQHIAANFAWMTTRQLAHLVKSTKLEKHLTASDNPGYLHDNTLVEGVRM